MVCITKFCLNSPSFHTYYQCQSLDLCYFTWMSSLTQPLKGGFYYLLTSYSPVCPLLATRISYLKFLWILISYNIKSHSVDINLSKLQEIVKDREAWHAEVHGVSVSRTRFSDWTTTNRKVTYSGKYYAEHPDRVVWQAVKREQLWALVCV